MLLYVYSETKQQQEVQYTSGSERRVRIVM